MPYGDDISALGLQVRSLIYGKAKSKKTWWTLRAAEAGFNVILFDGDKGAHIISQIAKEHRKRILVVDVNDKLDEAVFAKFVTMLCRPKNTFYWDEQAKAAAPGLKRGDHSFIHFDPQLFTTNDVVILDSWTQLAASMRFQYAIENKIDMTDAQKVEWDGYSFEGRFLDYALNYLHGLPCHFFVVGHEGKHEKRSKDGKTILSSDIVPISSSGPHGAKLAKHFSDVLYFERVSETKVQIKVSGDFNRDGGSRLMPPGTHNWDDFSPQKLFDIVGAKATGEPCRGAVWYKSGDDIQTGAKKVVPIASVVTGQAVKAPSETAIINPPAATEIKGSSLLSRLQSKKEQGG